MKLGHFHLHTSPVSRSKGHSAVAAAAYQSGQSLTHKQQRQFNIGLDHRKKLNKGIVTDELRQEFEAQGLHLSAQAISQKDGRRDWTITDGDKQYHIREVEFKVKDPDTGERKTVGKHLDVYADQHHDYRSREDVKADWIQAPANAPDWIRALENSAVEKKNREALWNWAEAADIARDARPARKIQVAFIRSPHLSYAQNIAVLREFVAEQFTSKGLIADVAVHSKRASDGDVNVHAHVLITTREVDEDGDLVENKNNSWNSKERVVEWRKAWTAKVNAALEANESNVRIDDRSYADQGHGVIPGQHMGPNNWNREQRGEKTPLGQQNEAFEQQNQKQDKQIVTLHKRVRARMPRAANENEPQAGSGLRVVGQVSKDVKWYGIGSRVGRDGSEEVYAARFTKTTWFGLGSREIRTLRPGMSSLSYKDRMELEMTTPRLTPGEVYERLEDYHLRTFAGMLGDSRSGSSTQAVEHLQRMAKWTREKVSEYSQRIIDRYASWRSREQDRRDHRGRDVER